jgi:hypothetical protein
MEPATRCPFVSAGGGFRVPHSTLTGSRFERSIHAAIGVPVRRETMSEDSEQDPSADEQPRKAVQR